MLSAEEMHKIDKLLGAALVDQEVRRRLLRERDHDLLSEYKLTDETQAWLSTIQATSLMELARAIVPNV
ncbi:MAG TPA: hypothetical protein ENI95_04430 [Chloroflexi bacterium]|nr:hypothetical protein [Chloroflexota bacterium]